MARTERRRRVDASQHRIWAVISDLENAAAWNPSIVSAACRPSNARGIGTRRTCFMEPSGRIDEEVTGWDEGRRIEMVVGRNGAIAGAVMSIEIAEDDEGAVVLATIDYRLAYGPLGPVMDVLMVHRQMGRMLERSLEGLKEHVEARSGSSP